MVQMVRVGSRGFRCFSGGSGWFKWSWVVIDGFEVVLLGSG